MLSRYPRLNQKLTSRLNWIFFFKTKKNFFSKFISKKNSSRKKNFTSFERNLIKSKILHLKWKKKSQLNTSATTYQFFCRNRINFAFSSFRSKNWRIFSFSRWFKIDSISSRQTFQEFFECFSKTSSNKKKTRRQTIFHSQTIKQEKKRVFLWQSIERSFSEREKSRKSFSSFVLPWKFQSISFHMDFCS